MNTYQKSCNKVKKILAGERESHFLFLYPSLAQRLEREFPITLIIRRSSPKQTNCFLFEVIPL